MNAVQLENNYYTMINGVNVYVDYYSSRLKVVDNTEISKNKILDIINFARKENLGKVIANCTVQMLKPYIGAGFIIEGYISGFLRGEDAYFVSYYISETRSSSILVSEEDEILRKIYMKKNCLNRKTDIDLIIRNAGLEDIPQMIRLFTATFKTYPSPVFNSQYLKKVINNKVIFKVALHENKIISIASADMDILNLNAEITDCATYENFRGKGVLSCLVKELEQDLIAKGFYTAYSLSRASNPGINSVFNKLHYKYCGRLNNNCYICGSLEDMNIWAKKLN